MVGMMVDLPHGERCQARHNSGGICAKTYVEDSMEKVAMVVSRSISSKSYLVIIIHRLDIQSTENDIVIHELWSRPDRFLQRYTSAYRTA